MSISSISAFIKILDHELSSFPACKIVFCAHKGQRALTNAAFLLGAYMIIKLGLGADEVARQLEWLGAPSSLEPPRSPSCDSPDHGLTMNDCWRGLERARAIGWVRAPTEGGQGGMIDAPLHARCGDAPGGGVHVVVPGKLVAFGGGASGAGGRRELITGQLAGVLAGLGATDVVRLGEAGDERAGLTSRGIAHHALPADDGSDPPDSTVAAFLAVADAAKGALAVHATGGLGQALVALRLMREHGFGARAAAGWLRIVLPGPAMGEPLRCLAAAERRTARTHAVMAAVRRAQAGTAPRGFRAAFIPAAGRRNGVAAGR